MEPIAAEPASLRVALPALSCAVALARAESSSGSLGATEPEGARCWAQEPGKAFGLAREPVAISLAVQRSQRTRWSRRMYLAVLMYLTSCFFLNGLTDPLGKELLEL